MTASKKNIFWSANFALVTAFVVLSLVNTILSFLYEFFLSGSGEVLFRLILFCVYAGITLGLIMFGISKAGEYGASSTGICIALIAITIFAIYIDYFWFVYFVRGNTVLSPMELLATAAEIADNGYQIKGFVGGRIRRVPYTFESIRGTKAYMLWIIQALIINLFTIIGLFQIFKSVTKKN